MGAALYFLIWGIRVKNEQLTVTFKYEIQFSKPRSRRMQNHERVLKILN